MSDENEYIPKTWQEGYDAGLFGRKYHHLATAEAYTRGYLVGTAHLEIRLLCTGGTSAIRSRLLATIPGSFSCV